MEWKIDSNDKWVDIASTQVINNIIQYIDTHTHIKTGTKIGAKNSVIFHNGAIDDDDDEDDEEDGAVDTLKWSEVRRWKSYFRFELNGKTIQLYFCLSLWSVHLSVRQ